MCDFLQLTAFECRAGQSETTFLFLFLELTASNHDGKEGKRTGASESREATKGCYRQNEVRKKQTKSNLTAHLDSGKRSCEEEISPIKTARHYPMLVGIVDHEPSAPGPIFSGLGQPDPKSG